MFENSNGRGALGVTLALALLAAACGASTTAGGRPTASLAATPTRADGMTRFSGTITDATTGSPIADACVIIGPPVDCQENFPHSDDKGRWFADLPAAGGLSWTFHFSKPGYELTTKKVTSTAPGEQTLDVQLPPK